MPIVEAILRHNQKMGRIGNHAEGQLVRGRVPVYRLSSAVMRDVQFIDPSNLLAVYMSIVMNRNQSRFQVLSVRGVYVATKIQQGHFPPRLNLRALARRGAKFDLGFRGSDVFRD